MDAVRAFFSRAKIDMIRLPPIYLINLDRSSERLRLFKDSNGHLHDVIRVAAADGSELDREALTRSGYIDSDLAYSGGTLGCAISHVKLWEVAAAEDRSLTVFEDDIVVSHHFERKAGEVLSSVPEDWDIVQWGCLLMPLFVWVDLGTCKARLQGYGSENYTGSAGLQQFQAEHFCPAPMRLLHSFGMQGYSISAKGARAALKYCLPLRKRLIQFPDAGVTTPDEGIDVALCGLYPSLKAFVCFPPLLIHRNAQESDRRITDNGQEAISVRIAAVMSASQSPLNRTRE
jgi:GR25 family glycosyltransferase involved in LPS biosynthesis